MALESVSFAIDVLLMIILGSKREL